MIKNYHIPKRKYFDKDGVYHEIYDSPDKRRYIKHEKIKGYLQADAPIRTYDYEELKEYEDTKYSECVVLLGTTINYSFILYYYKRFHKTMQSLKRYLKFGTIKECKDYEKPYTCIVYKPVLHRIEVLEKTTIQRIGRLHRKEDTVLLCTLPY